MREAVTAIFVFEQEVFIIRRQNYLRAFPGYYAFPGGKVDEEDGEFEYTHPLLSPYPGRQMRALLREVEEELGFDLEQAVIQGEVRSIDHFGEAITPAFEPVRFSAHYFKVVMSRRPDLRPDSQEIAWSGWVDHQALYDRFRAGEALMVVPTMHTVRALAEDIHATGAEPFNLEYDAERELPYLELLHGVGMIPVPSNTLPPAKATNALLIGDEQDRRFLIDPSPDSPEVYRKLCRTLGRQRVDALFITHHHPDHHERAPELAREFALPLFCSAKTKALMLERQGADYLDGIDIRLMEEGEVLTHWLGEPVRCHGLPGHDAGMMGLAPDNMAWCFVSDLVQAGATVVIPGREGDMQAYFDSLERVIAMQPRVLIPSHGMPTGGALLAEKTLQHRLERERQIREYYASGLDAEGITQAIYPNIEQQLMPLALQNVRQHLKKLGLG